MTIASGGSGSGPTGLRPGRAWLLAGAAVLSAALLLVGSAFVAMSLAAAPSDIGALVGGMRVIGWALVCAASPALLASAALLRAEWRRGRPAG